MKQYVKPCISETKNGTIEVHPEFQANGIASKLYESMLLWVQKKNLKVIETDASEVAMPIFKKWGFNITEKKFIKRGAEILTNYNMRKNI